VPKTTLPGCVSSCSNQGRLPRDLCGLDDLREDVRGGSLGGPDDVGVDAERDGRVGVTEAGRDDMDRDAGQKASEPHYHRT
jgi:hypothetical protein